jgi:hypothetical protein
MKEYKEDIDLLNIHFLEDYLNVNLYIILKNVICLDIEKVFKDLWFIYYIK